MGMRALILTLCVGGFGLWMLGPAKEPAPDPVVTASVNKTNLDFTVSNMENGTACLLTRGNRQSGHSSDVRPGHDCETVWPGLGEVRNWTQNADNTVTLTDDSGREVLTLAQGDGVDFEALQPDNAVLAFNAVN